MAHSYWITKDLIPLKTLLNIRLYTCGVLINLRWVCVCVCAGFHLVGWRGFIPPDPFWNLFANRHITITLYVTPSESFKFTFHHPLMN